MSSRTRTPAPAAATNPAGPSSDPVSDEAPGVRTEAEVLADEQAAADAAVNEAPPGATGNPLTDDDIPAEEDEDTLVHYERESDGAVQSVNAGSRAHRILANDRDWSEISRAAAKRAGTRSFTRTAKAKA